MNNALTKIIENLSKNANVKRFISDFDRLSKDLKKLQADLNQKFGTEKEQAIKKARAEYTRILGKVRVAEKDLNKEVKSAITKIRKSAEKVEKNLDTYKKKATAQQAKATKILKAKATTKKTAAKRTSKKTSKKA